MDTARTPTTAARPPHDSSSIPQPPKLPAFLLGLGLGGFIDGIVLHQVLQWNHLLSDTWDHPMTTVAGLEANTLADGIFHLSTWLFVAAGMALTISAWQHGRLAPPWRAHIGMLLVGWGVFNLVEGVIDHQILGIHHVRDDLGGPLSWDLGFLALGAGLVVVGVVLERSARGGGTLSSGAAPGAGRAGARR